MTQQHPITPPPELVEQWAHLPDDWNTVVFLIAQWGADQAKADIKRERQEAADEELEACIQVIADHGWFAIPEYRMAELRAARRPKPPSLKEQALEALMTADGPDHPTPMLCLRLDAASIIRRALEQLDD